VTAWEARRKDDAILCGRPDCGAEIARRKPYGERAHLVLRPGYVPDVMGLWRIPDARRERRYLRPRPGRRRGMAYESEERVMWEEAPGRRLLAGQVPPPLSAPMGWSPERLPVEVSCWRCKVIEVIDPTALAVEPGARGRCLRLQHGSAYPMQW